MVINLDRLLLYDHALYDKVVNAYGYKTGSVNYREDQFPADVWLELLEFTEHQKTTPPSSPAPPQRDFVTEVRADLDRAAADGRLQQLSREEGLLDNEANSVLIGKYFRDHKLVLNVENVDRAIAALRPQLAWRRKETPTSPPVPSAPVVAPPEPAASPTPAEVLGMVAGTDEPQLPIDADERMMKKASVKALQDLVARRRRNMSKYYRPSGSFGTSL